MPWKKNFEVEAAVGQAMQVFWEKGYQATSMTDITEATGVQRQSLYNAVGGKHQLFVRSLLKYDAEERRSMLVSLEARGKPLDALDDLFSGVVDQSLKDGNKRGCFLVNTALALDCHDEEVRLIISAAFDDFRNFLCRLIEHGKVRGEVPKHCDARAVAAAQLGIFIGIRALARGKVDETVLRQMASQALRLLS